MLRGTDRNRTQKRGKKMFNTLRSGSLWKERPGPNLRGEEEIRGDTDIGNAEQAHLVVKDREDGDKKRRVR